MTQAQTSIVLVTVDCLRADHVGFMGYGRPTTPFLDSLASESCVCRSAIVAGAPTYYSLPGILASRYPLALGRDILGISPDEPTLASVLKHAGYATAAFSAANPYISSRFGYDSGFDTFRDFLEGEPAPTADDHAGSSSTTFASRLNRKLQGLRPVMGPLRPVYDEAYFRYCQRVTPVPKSLDALRRFPAADEIVDNAIAWLADVGGSPFFLWLHLMDPHSPYYPKEQALELMGDPSISPREARNLNSYWNRSDLGPGRLSHHCEEIESLYDAGIRWVDSQLEQLISKLRSASRWNNCIFALTADHGEEFLDHGGRYHPPSRLMEEVIHVPLLLRVPGQKGNWGAKAPFSLIHLAPTLLDAARQSIPHEFAGRSQWQNQREEFAISECIAGCTNPFRSENRIGPRVLAVRGARFKLVISFDPRGEALYDLEADPREQSPLPLSAEPSVRRRLLEAAREHLKNSQTRRNSESRLRARLRDLQLEWKKSANWASPVAS
jgi:arylsulfatase A-like enzyme